MARRFAGSSSYLYVDESDGTNSHSAGRIVIGGVLANYCLVKRC